MKKILFIFAMLTAVSCVDGNYNYPDPYGYPNSGGYGYPNSGGYGYPNNNYPYDGGYNNNRCGGNKRCGHDRCGNNKRCGGDKRCGGNRDTVINVPPPPPPPQRQEVQPSCPSGTVLDSRGCRVTDSSKRRPGGDGYVNPCSSGYYSGGRCVSN